MARHGSQRLRDALSRSISSPVFVALCLALGCNGSVNGGTPPPADRDSALPPGVDAGEIVMPGTDAGPMRLPPEEVDPSCGLEGAAFCENFDEASPGGRGGDLDDNVWSFARVGIAGAQTANFAFVPTPLDLCGEEITVPHSDDSRFCTMADGGHRWAEAFDDHSGFIYNAGRIRQPFDFADRTGTVQFETDAKTSGGHGWWTETWITDAPIPGPNMHDPQLVSSANAIGITFFDDCAAPMGPGTTGSGLVGVSEIVVVRDYQAQFIDLEKEGCLRTAPQSLNRFQIRISQSHVEIWGSDEGTTELRRIAQAEIDLAFTRGYVHLTHVHYNAAKVNEGHPTYTVTSYQTYHWARAAFDGPQLTPPRGYTIGDPLTPISTHRPDVEALSIGYAVSGAQVTDGGVGPGDPVTLRFTGVDTTDAIGANLTFNTIGVAAGDTLRYRLNGGTWREWNVPSNLYASWERQAFSVPVPLEDVRAGDNTVEFDTTSDPFFLPADSMFVANIDLEIQLP
jgi:hypothetical protein